MKQLRIRVLAGVFAVAGVLAWAASRLWNTLGSLPAVPVLAPVVLAGIAAVLLATALSLRSRLTAQRERRPVTRPVEPMMAARAVLFGQASALVGALAAGTYGGAGLFLLTSDLFQVASRREQALYAALSVVAGAALVAVALWLQRICRIPEDHEQPGTAPAA
ncbi:DUF3180 domain-containing protein [Streptomyces sp. TRM 70351]|uniref:DUF3180 domain-containing protein n=1 Tax=Streptomyces sp. TRM 70351 TaxID=3116552 RepID=UPI002E7B7A47|nr:DUF3180 domain-containing protein [Streptomyces sp. TRM 70351]MEE1930363.1 DUF3180 domain-containing protein [Streptomyces sp. TRM 70351]